MFIFIFNDRRSEMGSVAAALLFSLTLGCSNSAPPPARSSDEIFKEQMALPAVYITDPSGHRIEASRANGVFVDEKTGEIAWPALACNRPECPGRGSDGQPFLFISPDPTFHVGPDGKIHADQTRAGTEPPHAGQCPKCWEKRNLGEETQQQKQQYIDWVVSYLPPESEQQLAELEEERIRRARRERHQDMANATGSD